MILTVVDHASNHVPPDLDLGIDLRLLETHIAWDIGALAVADALGYPIHAATVSRLVIDMNRDEGSIALVPKSSDGHTIPGNAGNTDDRVERYFHPYHKALAERIATERPSLILSLHSFTPQLKDGPQRPWQIGILYNLDDRAARIAIPMLRDLGIATGDQQPYSGRLLNATMNRHAEANGIPYLGIEIRQDQISTDIGAARWASRLKPVIDACADALSTASSPS